MLSDCHADVIVGAGDIKVKGHLAVASSVQNSVDKEPCCFPHIG
jgi:hypothetical protein